MTAAVAVAAVLGGLLLAGPATAATEPAPTPSPTRTLTVPLGTTVFTLAPVSNGVVRPGNALSASISLQNGTVDELVGTTVTLALGTAPIADREALGDWLAGTGDVPGLVPVGTTTFDAIAPDSSQVRSITVAADDPALAGRAPGVYPLVASYQDAEGTVTSTSTMIVPSEEVADVGLGVVVPITAGPLSEGLLTADELAELTAPDGALTAQLDSVTGTPAILAVDPAVPAAIRVLGDSAPESALMWLTRLDALQNSRFALQFGDADITAQLDAGLPRPLQPTSLTAYMSPADFPTPTPTATPTPTPTAGPTPAATSSLPSTEELLAVGPGTRPGVFWPAGGTADAGVVAQLAGLATDGTAPITLVPSATTAAGADGRTVPARGAVGDAAVLVYDSDVSHALEQASESEEYWLRGAPLTAATAYLAFATAETTGPLLVTVGRGDARSRVDLGATITAAFSAPGVVPRNLVALAASPPGDVELAELGETPERAAAASALVDDESALARFATILDQPSLLTGPERAEMLQVLGVAWIGDDAWPRALADHRAQTAETLDSVALLPTSPSDLYGSSAALRFWVRNDLPYPVNLVLYTTRDNLRLDVQSETPVVATPQSNTRVEVPVQARVGRGDVTLTLQLRSPAFVAIGDAETVEVNVWADWEAAGITALAVLVGGLLLVGIARTVLRMRRRRRGKDAATAGDADGEAVGEAGSPDGAGSLAEAGAAAADGSEVSAADGRSVGAAADGVHSVAGAEDGSGVAPATGGDSGVPDAGADEGRKR
ncbi:DUF6049 family protein [Microbacterium sp. M3]|uniref:DUF6049 family protein n=1 Tax=Microbacterium arthrosphaerae TaxID=792652 RepID=A0ABU4H6V0_9MICO|nr:MULTISPECIES: DUF6049 family protein [Microbacterium]MDW4574364.1 DUF6049 family protein [Microbacterium arthrosphaerae]MDW7608219.1 DUF6049 family protein [Microbacterium sp. M3]